MKLFHKKQKADLTNTQCLALGILQIRLQAKSGGKQLFYTQISMEAKDTQCAGYIHRDVWIDAFFSDLEVVIPFPAASALNPLTRAVVSAKVSFNQDNGEKDWLPTRLGATVRNFDPIPERITEGLTSGKALESIRRFVVLFAHPNVKLV